MIEKLYQQFLEHPFISTDTRSIDKGTIFFALKGETFNGNRYALEALKKGAALAIVDEVIDSDDPRIWHVEDSLKCLQALANYHRKHYKIPILGITGTNGKTTSKELITTVLSEKCKVTATQGNLNNHIGVPLTLLKINSETEIAVIEMGANHLGEIGDLCNIAMPDYGLITNIGHAHLEGFGSFEGVKQAKGELYDYIKLHGGELFRNADNKVLEEIAGPIPSLKYSGNSDGEVFGQVIQSDPFLSIEFFDRTDNVLQPFTISTKLAGEYNFENVMAAVRVGLHFGVAKSQIIHAIDNYQPKNNRSQIVETERNKLVVDAYNANPSSMAQALANLHKMKSESRSLVLGDMLELGDYSLEHHKKILDSVRQYEWGHVFLVGPEFHTVAEGEQFQRFMTVDELADYLQDNKIANELILIKGSRGMQLEKVIEYL